MSTNTIRAPVASQAASPLAIAFGHPLGICDNSIAFVGQHETVGRALKERVTDGLFQRAEPAPHRWLRLPEPACRGAERAFPGNGQKDPKVAPLQGPASNKNAWPSCSIEDFQTD